MRECLTSLNERVCMFTKFEIVFSAKYGYCWYAYKNSEVKANQPSFSSLQTTIDSLYKFISAQENQD
jgi:hypothetical protein